MSDTGYPVASRSGVQVSSGKPQTLVRHCLQSDVRCRLIARVMIVVDGQRANQVQDELDDQPKIKKRSHPPERFNNLK